MTIVFHCSLDPAESERVDPALLASSSTDIVGHFFWGDAKLKIGAWVYEVADLPVLYFAHAVWKSVHGLRDGEVTETSVPEVSDWLSFTRRGDKVEIVPFRFRDFEKGTRRRSGQPAVATHRALEAAVRDCLVRLLATLEARWPVVAKHPDFRALRQELGE